MRELDGNDWADVEAMREVDALAPAAPPISPRRPPAEDQPRPSPTRSRYSEEDNLLRLLLGEGWTREADADGYRSCSGAFKVSREEVEYALCKGTGAMGELLRKVRAS